MIYNILCILYLYVAKKYFSRFIFFFSAGYLFLHQSRWLSLNYFVYLVGLHPIKNFNIFKDLHIKKMLFFNNFRLWLRIGLNHILDGGLCYYYVLSFRCCSGVISFAFYSYLLTIVFHLNF